MDENTRLARWNDLVEGFRRFGGTADNLIQRKGALGLGLFPIDASQPVELRVPEHLLVATDNIDLLDGAIVLKDTSCYPKGFGEWYEYFQAEYSWGAEARNSIQRFEEGLKSLPDSLRKKLQSLGLNIKEHFPDAYTEQHVLQRFIKTRRINRNGKLVLMPMIELVNHSPFQSSWISDEDAIAVKGRYDDEILVKYSVSDPLRRWVQYGFNCKEPSGFSLSVKLLHNQQKIIVNGGINNKIISACNIFAKHQLLIVDKPLLSSVRAPKLARTLFRESCKKYSSLNADELFDQIHSTNRLMLINIISDLQMLHGDAANQLKNACLDQIEVLSGHIGAKSVPPQTAM